ncbi:MAG: LysE family translocator [Pseudomonadota bacterium]
MASPETLIAFFAAALLFAVFPGPAVIYTATRTLAEGRRAGLLAVAGLQIGGLAHVLAAAAGLSALLNAVPTAYLILKIAGALYLVWIGIGLILRVPERVEAVDVDALAAVRRGRALRGVLQGMLVEVLNPKAALFYVAFLPQFVDPAAAFAPWVQFLVLGLVVNVMFGMVDLASVVSAAAMTARMRRSTTLGRLVRRAGGAVLIALGARLAIER